MVKRQHEDELLDADREAKRRRPLFTDRLSQLSDELILRVLSFLSVSELVKCHRISPKFDTLAGDNQLWKSLYYDRFVRPRASRISTSRSTTSSQEQAQLASKATRWLEDDHLIRRGVHTNWKRQYKLRNNWAKGTCAVSEIPVAEEPRIPPLLVQMQDGVIYTAGHQDGLRAWSVRGDRKLVAQINFPTGSSPPTAMSVDGHVAAPNCELMIGFQDGSFEIYELDGHRGCFKQRYLSRTASQGVISAVALEWPYAVTMTATQLLTIYRFDDSIKGKDHNFRPEPRVLHALKSHTVWPPQAVSLRVSKTSVLTSIAYALPTYLSGWTVGIQEVRISPEGVLQESRLASAIEQHYRPLAFSTQPMIFHLTPSSPSSTTFPTTSEVRHIHTKPTSLSYTHPYLLVSHPDNTLTLYLVSSTTESLSIGAGCRLWGHTSSVSGAHVGGRGKAVSVSKKGDELRVWELEGGFTSSAARKRLATGNVSVQIRPNSQPNPLQLSTKVDLNFIGRAMTDRSTNPLCAQQVPELALTRGWVGFDEENVVVLREENHGKQALMVYDFT